jgi:hypothetical protein
LVFAERGLTIYCKRTPGNALENLSFYGIFINGDSTWSVLSLEIEIQATFELESEAPDKYSQCFGMAKSHPDIKER